MAATAVGGVALHRPLLLFTGAETEVPALFAHPQAETVALSSKWQWGEPHLAPTLDSAPEERRTLLFPYLILV